MVKTTILLLASSLLLVACNSANRYTMPTFSYWYGKGTITASDSLGDWRAATAENQMESARTWSWIMDGSKTLDAEGEARIDVIAEGLVQCLNANPQFPDSQLIGEEAPMCFGFAKGKTIPSQPGEKVSFKIYPLVYARPKTPPPPTSLTLSEKPAKSEKPNTLTLGGS